MTADNRLAGFAISPHRDAPQMSQPDGPLILQQVLCEVGSGGITLSGEIADLVRQAGLVNLWFFLRYIAGYRGPYQKLNTEMHLEMCNFYQMANYGGAKSITCMPRGSYKSTICTHGGLTWRLVRNPNVRCGILVASADRGDEFYNNAKRNFDSNELISTLYPYTKPNKETTWNSESFTLPGRTRSFVEPSLKYVSIDSSTAGNHFDVLGGDDIVGDAQLNSDRSTSADMERAKGKFKSAIRTIIDDPNKSIVSLACTRYASNDAYDWIFDDVRVSYGNSEFVDETKDTGEWLLYGRSVIEDGTSICPERWSDAWLNNMKETDPWTFWTQYMNNPSMGGMGDLSQYRIQEAEPIWSDNKWWIDFKDDKEPVPLSSFTLVAGADPAASERRGSVKTSKHAIVVLAIDKAGRVVVLDAWSRHAPILKLFDQAFIFHRTWKFPLLVFEMQGPFKMLRSIFSDEQKRRNYPLNVLGVDALGDKIDTARTLLQPLLEKNMLYASKKVLNDVEHAVRNFPTGNMDLIDAIKLALSRLHKPKYEDGSEFGGRKPYRMLDRTADALTGM